MRGCASRRGCAGGGPVDHEATGGGDVGEKGSGSVGEEVGENGRWRLWVAREESWRD